MTTKDIMEVGEQGKVTLQELLAEDKVITDVVSITKKGKEWHVLIEVLERRGVPDTQDIIGKYRLKLDEKKEVLGYERVELRRRGDVGVEEEAEI
ncbi:MAG: gas vesicle protein GvpO [Methanobacterium sp.]|jgi:hypothetical protein